MDRDYFSEAELLGIEQICMSNSGIAQKDLALLSGIMNFLDEKGYMSHLQKANVHRILTKYAALVEWLISKEERNLYISENSSTPRP